MLRLSDIEAARSRIRDTLYLSPCAHSRTLSRMFGCQVHLKLENLQMTGSFKERGACNKLELLTPEERASGVITASAGNHAQGVAYHSTRLGMRATVVMPLATALVKVTSTRDLGAEVVLHGGNFDEAQAEARRLQIERRATYVHPFDDEAVMAGQGTLGLELLEQLPNVDVVIVPVGGGGLASGMAVALKESRPNVRVIGVETSAVPSMTAARAAGGPVAIEGRQSIADGIAVRKVGERCFEVCQRYLDDMITVDEDVIAEAVLLLLEREKTVAEGAGATALAAVLSGQLALEGKRVGVLVSGGNIDVNLVSRVIDRGLWRSGRLIRLRCVINDVPGALSALLGLIAGTNANVLEIEHERVGDRLALGQTTVEILCETRGFEHVSEIESVLDAAKISVERTSGPTDPTLRGTLRRSIRT